MKRACFRDAGLSASGGKRVLAESWRSHGVLGIRPSGKVTMDITYRPGRKGDSEKIAELISLASGGVVEYLFHGVVPGFSANQILTYGLKNDQYPHSYRSAIVAEHNQEVVGMALSYPSHLHGITPEMRAFFPEDRLEHLTPFYSARVEDSWLLDALCVVMAHRRKGTAKTLISLTGEKALENGYATLSLIVFADNTPALSLYEQLGFEVVQPVELKGNAFIPHEKGCLLLRTDLATEHGYKSSR
jgi:ribosomal protein S18 acetylase RimI-like enzyme